YRTDRFAGWVNQPANGTPLFSYSTIDYTLLTDATLAPTPAPVASGATAAPATPGSSGSGAGGPASTGSDSSQLVVGAVVVVHIVDIGGWLLLRGRRPRAEEE